MSFFFCCPQFKLSNILGDEIQHLVLITSTPQKCKVQTGPARLHIRNNKFCLTTGIPPRLEGVWEISKLRRYGIVNSRFVFEGGTRCGKGEGIFVLVTDQAGIIVETIKLASAGKLKNRRKFFGMKSTDSVPKSFSVFQLKNNFDMTQSFDGTSFDHKDEETEIQEDDSEISFKEMSRCKSCFSQLNSMTISRSSKVMEDYYVQLPIHNSCDFIDKSYENYDIPKFPISVKNENYDTPKSVNGNSAIYASIDRGKKIRNRIVNYENLSFCKSLENYENSKQFSEKIILQQKEEQDDSSTSSSQTLIKPSWLRRSLSSNFKNPNRDSSSSNDSGLSIFELPTTNSSSTKLLKKFFCSHSSSNSMTRSKSLDPLQDIEFKFQPEKKLKHKPPPHPNYIDSTSSGTSDISDYMESMSMSSYSSVELKSRPSKPPITKMRPRSGSEYQNIERPIFYNNFNNKGEQTSVLSKLRKKFS